MAMKEEYSAIVPHELLDWVITAKHDGWQFVQMLAARTEEGTDLLYSLRKDDTLWTRTVMDVQPEDEVPSITDVFLSAFVFENEAHDLFGVNIRNIAIDFAGKFYNVATDAPMSIIPANVAARHEKVAKTKAGKQAKAERDAAKRSLYPALNAAGLALDGAFAEDEDVDGVSDATWRPDGEEAASTPAMDMGDVVTSGGEWWPTAGLDPSSYRAPKAVAAGPMDMGDVVESGGEWWPTAGLDPASYRAPKPAGDAAQPACIPGEVEEGGEWWPRAAVVGSEV